MTDLLAATAELVAIPSLSRQEGVIADYVEAALGQIDSLEVVRVGDNVVARTALGRARRLVLAGHLDTVPPKDNASPRIDDETLWGLGSADMKGGLAVMLDLAARVSRPQCDVTYIFYAAEEIARSYSGLLVLAAAPTRSCCRPTPPSSVNRRTLRSRPAVRACSKPMSCLQEDEPIQRGHGPGATPSTGCGPSCRWCRIGPVVRSS